MDIKGRGGGGGLVSGHIAFECLGVDSFCSRSSHKALKSIYSFSTTRHVCKAIQ